MSIYQKYATSRYSSESKARPVAKAQETVPPALDLPSSPDQLSTVSGQIVSLEERMGNLTRLVKLLQSCVNTQEAETKKIRVDFMSYASNCTFDCKTDQRLGMIEGKFEELEKTLNSNQNVNAEKIQGLEKQLIDSEAKIMKAIDEKFSKMREALISREENVNIEGIQEDVNKLNSMLSEWKCGVEEQLNSMKNIVLGKVDAAEVSRVLAMLEEEVERREQGDNKALEVAVHAEELCKELNEIIQKEFGVFVQPETEASTKPNPKPKKTSRKKEKENNDPHYLKTFEKTLTKKLEKGLENIAKIVEKTYYNKPPPVEYDSESDSTSQIGRTVTEISTLNGSLSRSDINSGNEEEELHKSETRRQLDKRVSEMKQRSGVNICETYARSKSNQRVGSSVSPYLTMRAGKTKDSGGVLETMERIKKEVVLPRRLDFPTSNRLSTLEQKYDKLMAHKKSVL